MQARAIFRAACLAGLLALGSAPARAEVDPATQRALLSDRSMADLAKAADIAARVFNVVGSGGAFSAGDRGLYLQHLKTMQPARANEILHLSQNVPLALAHLNRLTPTMRANLNRAFLSDSKGGQDPLVNGELMAHWASLAAPDELKMRRSDAHLQWERSFSANQSALFSARQQQMDTINRGLTYNCSGLGDAKFRSSDGYCHNNPTMPNVSGGQNGSD